jgi:hypothetical protein
MAGRNLFDVLGAAFGTVNAPFVRVRSHPCSPGEASWPRRARVLVVGDPEPSARNDAATPVRSRGWIE